MNNCSHVQTFTLDKSPNPCYNKPKGVRSMTLEQYNELFASVTPDNASEILLKLKEAISEDVKMLETTKQQYEDVNNKVSELRDTNMKLFLRVGTTQNPENVETQPSADEQISEIIKQMEGK